MRKTARFIGAALTGLLLFPQSVLAEERIALVIGNGSYEETALDNPPRDAELMARTLQSLDFDVTLAKDVSQKKLRRLIRDFGERLLEASDAVGFFFYSGHGMQVKGRNYMIPVDATINKEPDVRIESVEADNVLAMMEYAGAKMNIVVLDACRSNPFEKRFKSPGEGIGLATMQAPAGTLVAYATTPGDVADPGPKGGYSPFTEVLARELRFSDASVLSLFNSVSTKVYNHTKRKQRPYVESSAVPLFALRAPVSKPRSSGAAQPAVGTYPSQPGETFRDCAECPEMVVIPAGSFMMGSPKSKRQPEAHWLEEIIADIAHSIISGDEAPQHIVKIAHNFAIGRFEVTRGEFAAFVSSAGYQTEGGCQVDTVESKIWQPSLYNWRDLNFEQGGDHPVVCVSWEDATAYVRWLSEKTGAVYRLPSESEWEYAARAGTTATRYWGERSSDACDYANVADRSARKAYPDWSWTEEIHECEDGYSRTAPVGTYQLNDFGLYDMLGNVSEWVEDCRNSDYVGAPTDGSAWINGYCEQRVVRSGSWRMGPEFTRSAARLLFLHSNVHYNYVGFRVARTLQ